MTYDEFNAYCGSLTATTYVMQWGGAHVWKVGGKVFAIGGWSASSDDERQTAFTFKVSKVNFELLSEEAGYRPAPYMAARGMTWIQQTATSGELDEDLLYYLESSYRLVASGLSKKKQKELGLSLE